MIVKHYSSSLEIQELKLILEREFSGKYTYRIFHFSNQESLIVRKSALVAVQITVYDDEIIVDASYPNLIVSSIANLLFASTIYPFNAWLKFEKEISGFLKKKFDAKMAA